MKMIQSIVWLSVLGAFSLPAQAAGDAAAGQKIATEKCQACHGADGNSKDPQYPRLAGQYADYLERTLTEYKSGARKNPIMAGFAAGLSEQDIKDVAAWFSRQSGLTSPDIQSTVSK